MVVDDGTEMCSFRQYTPTSVLTLGATINEGSPTTILCSSDTNDDIVPSDVRIGVLSHGFSLEIDIEDVVVVTTYVCTVSNDQGDATLSCTIVGK